MALIERIIPRGCDTLLSGRKGFTLSRARVNAAKSAESRGRRYADGMLDVCSVAARSGYCHSRDDAFQSKCAPLSSEVRVSIMWVYIGWMAIKKFVI